uniref:Uncharacterized protein n=1 Tax=Oreochromis niloticus TaxID=8128 RepID=A0A669CJD9_ORENI
MATIVMESIGRVFISLQQIRQVPQLLTDAAPSMPGTVRDTEVPSYFRERYVCTGYRPLNQNWRYYFLSLFLGGKSDLAHYCFYFLDYVGVAQYQYGSAVVHFYYAVDESVHGLVSGIFMPTATISRALRLSNMCLGVAVAQSDEQVTICRTAESGQRPTDLLPEGFPSLFPSALLSNFTVSIHESYLNGQKIHLRKKKIYIYISLSGCSFLCKWSGCCAAVCSHFVTKQVN